MLAKCGLISELMYSNSTFMTGAQASTRSAKVWRSSSWITRISVTVNSRPSMRVGYRPSPPKKLSTTANTSFGSNTIRPMPRSGLKRIRLRLVGTYSECMYSPNLTRSIPRTDRSAERRIRLNRPMRQSRTKRSLTISRVGIRPRMIRSWLAKSYGRATPGSTGSGPVLTTPESTPCRRASISSWESRSLLLMGACALLGDEAGEQQRLGAGLAGFGAHQLAHLGQGFGLQPFLAGAVGDALGVLLGQQHQQPRADGRGVALQVGQGGRVAGHQLDFHLQVLRAVQPAVEVDHERGLQRQVLGRRGQLR